MNVLILIQDQKHAETLQQILRSAGYTVIRAEDEASCRSLAVKGDPGLIVIDNAFGAALAEDLRRIVPGVPLLGWIPVYDARLAVQFMKSGVYDCLCPPLQRQEALDTAAHTIERFYGSAPKRKLSPVYYAALRFGRMFLLGLGIIALMWTAEIFLPKSPVEEKIDLPYQHPTALAWDGKYLWVSNWYTQSVYRYERIEKDLHLTGTYYFGDFGPVAIARAGNYLWSAGNDLTIRRHALNDRLETVQSYSFPEYTTSGMTASDNTLWICDSYKKKIYKYSAGYALVLKAAYDCPLFSPAGLCWTDGTLWIADSKTDRVYLYRELEKDFRLKTVYQLPVTGAGDQLAGIAVETRYLYVAYSGKHPRLSKYALKNLKQVHEKGREYLSAVAAEKAPVAAPAQSGLPVIKIQ